MDETATGPPPPEQARVATITLGVDGRLYFHDLPLEMLEVAAELCPTAPAITERLNLIREVPEAVYEHSTNTIEE